MGACVCMCAYDGSAHLRKGDREGHHPADRQAELFPRPATLLMIPRPSRENNSMHSTHRQRRRSLAAVTSVPAPERQGDAGGRRLAARLQN
eukprot:scaffold11020_cov91-Isochrysis_galbana.AAC.3